LTCTEAQRGNSKPLAAKHTKNRIQDGRDVEPKSHDVGVQIPTRCSKKGAVRIAQSACGGGISTTGAAKGRPDRARALDGRFVAHDGRDSAKVRDVTGDRVLTGKERDRSGEGVPGEAAQLRGSALLGQRVLCFDGRSARRADPAVRPTPGRGRQTSGTDQSLQMNRHRRVAPRKRGRVSDPEQPF